MSVAITRRMPRRIGQSLASVGAVGKAASLAEAARAGSNEGAERGSGGAVAQHLGGEEVRDEEIGPDGADLGTEDEDTHNTLLEVVGPDGPVSGAPVLRDGAPWRSPRCGRAPSWGSSRSLRRRCAVEGSRRRGSRAPTRAPSAASSLAVSRPITVPPPVTIATCPSSCRMADSSPTTIEQAKVFAKQAGLPWAARRRTTCACRSKMSRSSI